MRKKQIVLFTLQYQKILNVYQILCLNKSKKEVLLSCIISKYHKKKTYNHVLENSKNKYHRISIFSLSKHILM